jgi:hypothetical protein
MFDQFDASSKVPFSTTFLLAVDVVAGWVTFVASQVARASSYSVWAVSLAKVEVVTNSVADSRSAVASKTSCWAKVKADLTSSRVMLVARARSAQISDGPKVSIVTSRTLTNRAGFDFDNLYLIG